MQQKKQSSHLDAAAKRGDLVRTRELLAQGADPQSLKDHRTAMRWALFAQSLPCVEALLKAGADPNHRPEHEAHPMVLAACIDDRRIIQALIRAGGNVDAANSQGQSCCLLAANFGHVGCLEVLLAHGAHASLADQGGATPLSAAREEGQLAAAALLEAHELALAAKKPSESPKASPRI